MANRNEINSVHSVREELHRLSKNSRIYMYRRMQPCPRHVRVCVCVSVCTYVRIYCLFRLKLSIFKFDWFFVVVVVVFVKITQSEASYSRCQRTHDKWRKNDYVVVNFFNPEGFFLLHTPEVFHIFSIFFVFFFLVVPGYILRCILESRTNAEIAKYCLPDFTSSPSVSETKRILISSKTFSFEMLIHVRRHIHQ